MQTPNVKIDPWRGGKRAAVALTFDDWTPGHAAVALPALERAGLCATFFVPLAHFQLSPELDHWALLQRLHRAGHELGNHSRTHTDLRGASRSVLYAEVTRVKEIMEAELYGVPVEAFCPPYGKADSALLAEVRKGHLCARGYDEDPRPLDLSYDFAQSIDSYFELRPLRVNQQLSEAAWRGLLEQAIRAGGLLTAVVHGVFNRAHPRDATWFDALSELQLEGLLAELAALEPELWVTPLTEAVKYHQTARTARVTATWQGPGVLALRVHRSADAVGCYDTPITVTIDKLPGEHYQPLDPVQANGTWEESESSLRVALAPAGPPLVLRLGTAAHTVQECLS